MKPTDKINDLQRQIAEEQAKVRNCKHDWTDTKYDPETVKEIYGYRIEAHGSDVWTVPEGYHDVQKARWSRTCKECGKVEYTYEQETVQVIKKPKF